MPLDLHSADPENKDRERFLKKALGSVTLYQKKIQAYAPYFTMPKMKAQMGTINPQIIKSNPEPQIDSLTNLPRELGSVVWEHLDEPADRLMLALTCKFNAGMYEELKDVKGQPSMIRAAKGTNLKTKSTKAKAVRPQGVQKRRPNSALRGNKTETMAILRRLRPWMKATQDLCHVCLQYKPRSATCDVRDFKERGGWGGRAFPDGDLDGRKKITLKMLEVEGRRCPVCVVRKHAEYMADTSAAAKTIKAIIRSTE